MEYTSQGQGTLNTVLGSIGTAGATGILGNLFGNGNVQYVNKEAYDVQMKLIEAERSNAILSADLNTERKMVEVFNAANDKIMNVRDELNAAIREVDHKVDTNAATQAVINTQVNSQVALNSNNISQLLAMTKLVIPNTSVCPGWGTVTVTPTINGTQT